MDIQGRKRLISIEGLPPVLYDKPNACPFAPRCRYRVEHCLKENPPLMEIEAEHRVACWVDPATGRERS
jgi:oligopeptide/dipeptide ABC transporter ATP-binding protein